MSLSDESLTPRCASNKSLDSSLDTSTSFPASTLLKKMFFKVVGMILTPFCLHKISINNIIVQKMLIFFNSADLTLSKEESYS